MLQTLRRETLSFLVDDVFFQGLAWIGRKPPVARPERHGVVVEPDVAYLPGGGRAHHADVYRPRDPRGPLPVVLYAHGGGFRKLSKDTHWVMGLAFARRGYLAYNLNYRLGREHPFPHALEDLSAALRFVVEDAPRRGGDLNRLVLAGESAGANLATALTLAACYRRPEPWAAQVFGLGVTPRVTVPACGILQVSDTRRFDSSSTLTRDLVRLTAGAYLGDEDAAPSEARLLADPLLVLERGQTPDRPLPAFFAGVGTWDPLLDDTRRLAAALTRLGVPHEARYYERGIHAFQALVFLEHARRYWQDLFAFLERHLERAARAA